jgi:2,3,4,5-tetrahydropyridine-2-carboxylate N-succinyltransferase
LYLKISNQLIKKMSQQLQTIIDQAWENRAQLNISNAGTEITQAVDHVIGELNAGRLRVSTKKAVGQWETHQWIKKAVLLSFKFSDNVPMHAGDLGFYDKVPTKFASLSEQEMKESGVRVVPPAVARRGSNNAKGAI